MEFVPGKPDLLLDGAHNRASVERLAEGLARHFAGRRLGVVFAAAADKDLGGMMAALVDRLPAAPVVFTKAASPRAAEPADLAALYAKAGGRGAETAATPAQAIALAARRAGPQALVVVTGSLYLVGQIEAMIRTGDGNVQC
jgi:dihydrofolate synthase/folylpolyglutamate synthase